jgi:hypothetical protein
MSYSIPSSNNSVVQTNNYPSLSIMTKDQWICWTREPKQSKNDPQFKKPPINPQTGTQFDWTDSSNHLPFQTARSKSQTNPKIDGIAFVFTAHDPIVGIDLDECISNNQLTDHAQQIVNQIDSYTEVSPSGDGIHILLEGDLPESVSNNQAAIEIYDQGRYFTVTGDRLPGTPKQINSRQASLVSLIESHNLESSPSSSRSPSSSPSSRQSQNATLSVDDNLVSKGRTALEELKRESHTGFDQLVKLCQGKRSPLTQYNDGQIDRSASNFTAISLLACTVEWADCDSDQYIQIAKQTLTQYCQTHQYTTDGQSRKWTARGDTYRARICEYARHSRRMNQFWKLLHKSPDVRRSHQFSTVTRAAVRFAFHILFFFIAPSEDEYDDAVFDYLDQIITDLCRHLQFSLEYRQPLECHLHDNTPPTCLKLSTPRGGNNHPSTCLKSSTPSGGNQTEQIEQIDWYPCKDDIIQVAQIIDPDRAPSTHRKCLYELADESRTVIEQINISRRYDEYQTVYSMYPAFPSGEVVESSTFG